jgi:hypothetical protein
MKGYRGTGLQPADRKAGERIKAEWSSIRIRLASLDSNSGTFAAVRGRENVVLGTSGLTLG